MEEALKMPAKSRPYQFKEPKTVNTKTGPKSRAEIEIDKMIAGLKSPISNAHKEQASFMLKNFIKGEDFPIKHTTGYDSKLLKILINGLLIIMNFDKGNSDKAKEKIRQALNPLTNPALFKQIIDRYNKASDSVSTIKGNTKPVNIIMNKNFSYHFDNELNKWLRDHGSELSRDLGSGFIGHFIDYLYFGFNNYYNKFIKNPEKYPQLQALINPKLVGPKENKPEIDRSKHTISDIVKYIYSPGAGEKFDPKRLDAFNNANKEILSLLKSSIKNPRSWKIFQYVVMDKLDAEEIIGIDKDFPTPATVTGAFRDLAVMNKKASEVIDSIYKKNRLSLPSFKTWSTSDLSKSPLDRGELTPTHQSFKSINMSEPELGRDTKGKLAKVSYDKYGEKQYSPLQELRLFIRKTINESINK